MARSKRNPEQMPLGYDLPGFDRDPTKAPDQYFQKGADGALTVIEGRRPSSLLNVNAIRQTVDTWRKARYEGASQTTLDLFRWWFDESDDGRPDAFRLYWGQREAIETLAYLVEIARATDVKDVIESYAQLPDGQLLDITFQETVDNVRQILVPGRGAPMNLPPAGLRRYACKAATGSGKTIVMALAVVWSYFHALRETDSPLATNFLIIAPNVIVFERLRVDFENGNVFRERSLIPPGWAFDLNTIMRGESTEPAASGNVFLTNIQQLYEGRGDWSPANAIEALLGRKPSGDVTTGRSMLERVRSLGKLVVLNDEAHHVHDDDLEWNKTLLDLHGRLPSGLSLWLDFSATPKFQTGAYFAWVVTDYPLAQAVEDGIVKNPVILSLVEKPDPTGVTTRNAVEKYGDWITAGVRRLNKLGEVFQGIPDAKPVMFLMCESIPHADAVARWLRDPASGFEFKDEEVLVIHTGSKGDVKKSEEDELRKKAREVDDPASPIRVVVSVLVLREGWDVRNVMVVLGLRPGTAEARILPEQAVGRGLRLMRQLGPEQRQPLEVLGTPAFEEFVRELETEGVHVPTVVKAPDPGIKITPIRERLTFDISIPRTGPILQREYKRVSEFDPLKASPVFPGDEVASIKKLELTVTEATHEVKLGGLKIDGRRPGLSEEIIASIVNKAQAEARIIGEFASLVPKVRTYLEQRCFSTSVNLADEKIRAFLSVLPKQEAVAQHLGRILGALTAEGKPLVVEPDPIQLSDTAPFLWRRQHCVAAKTVFNFVATYNDFESEFAESLDRWEDVVAFGALAEHFTSFGVAYLKPSGALGTYYPDWVVRQRIDGNDEEAYWMIETKGRVWDGTEAKDAAIGRWCEQVTKSSGADWSYVRVNQSLFETTSWETLAQLTEAALERARAEQTTLGGVAP